MPAWQETLVILFLEELHRLGKTYFGDTKNYLSVGYKNLHLISFGIKVDIDLLKKTTLNWHLPLTGYCLSHKYVNANYFINFVNNITFRAFT
jgi:hypothetical protein